MARSQYCASFNVTTFFFFKLTNHNKEKSFFSLCSNRVFTKITTGLKLWKVAKLKDFCSLVCQADCVWGHTHRWHCWQKSHEMSNKTFFFFFPTFRSSFNLFLLADIQIHGYLCWRTSFENDQYTRYTRAASEHNFPVGFFCSLSLSLSLACYGEWWGDSSLERKDEGLQRGGVWLEGGVRNLTKFPKEQFQVMDEYAVAVKFPPRECVCVCVCGRWRDAEWFQRALKLPWIWFSVPARVLTGDGAFLWSLLG